MRPSALPWSASSIARAIAPRLREFRVELLIVVVVTLLATVPRVVLLVDIPPGFHGDEGLTGMRADAILSEGWIGVFDSKHAMGQPAGAEYWTAALVWLFGNSAFVLRFAMALLGIITLPLAYLFYRLAAGRTVAVIGLLLLAFSGWHLHYSRIALPPVSLPLMAVLAATLLLAALRWRSWWLFLLAGACLGLGIYTYNAYPFYGLAVGIFVVGWLAVNRREWTKKLAAQIALFAVAALLAALPMFYFAATQSDAYFSIARRDSLLNSETYKAAEGLPAKADVILDSGRDYVKGAVFESRPDYVDASGTRPILDPLTSVALGLGVLLALWRWREPGIALALIVLFVVPWAGIMTTGSGTFRRTVGLTAFVPLLAALPLAYLVDEGRKRGRSLAVLTTLVVALAVGGVIATNLTYYFGSFPDNATARWVFAYPMAKASRYIDKLPDDSYVYFYSGRWSFNYETRRYLAPDAQGEDRSAEFGTFDLTPGPHRDVVYVFIDPYLDQADEVERLYPGGTRFDSVDDDGTIVFSAYSLPPWQASPEGGSETPPAGQPTATPGPSPTVVPAQATATTEALAGARDRDVSRVRDLASIKDALQHYRGEHGTYPKTGGSIQTLCAYSGVDQGCDLTEVLSPLPEDPLGDPTVNGYWYESDGVTYVLYAQRESDQFEECAEHPAHLRDFESVLCAEGP